MTGIAQNIELYNLAYKLAWKHIAEVQKDVYPDIASRLHESIRRQLKEGVHEPVFMAAEALRELGRFLLRKDHARGKRLQVDRSGYAQL